MQPPSSMLMRAESLTQWLRIVLAAVVDAHEDAELDELVKLLQRDAPDAGQLLRGFLLGPRAVAPATQAQASLA